MLQIKHLTVTHKKDLRTIVEDFSFTLQSGDKAVVIGEEGDGKSTLLKLIYDERLVSDYAEYSGEVIRGGLRLGYLSQEVPRGELKKSVAAFCRENADFRAATPRELAAAAARLGFHAGLFDSERELATLSGGEKVRLRLALMLLSGPDALLLDEPSNDLDLEALEWLERFINSCGLPVMFVSHDETLIENTANAVIHLEQVRRKTRPRCTVERMPYRQYCEERLSLFERNERIAKKERDEYDKKQEKLRQIESKVEHRQNAISRGDPHGGKLLKKKMKAVKSMGRRFEKERESFTERPDSEEAIAMKFDPGTAVPDRKTVLDFSIEKLSAGGRILAESVSLSVTGPQKVCIVGKNGAGKTTLLKLIAENLLARRDIKAGYMPQDYGDLLGENATPVAFLSKSVTKEEITRVRTLLGSMRYTTGEMGHSVSELSGGQKAKLLFLKLILDGCNVLVLDEPTRNLSPLSGPVVRGMLKSFGGAIISVSHDRKYIAEVCDRVYELGAKGLSPR